MMNKNEFLQALDKELSPLALSERCDILDDLNEYFNQGVEKGKSESEMLNSLGSVNELAKQYLQDIKPKRNMAGQIGAALILIFFNLVIVIGPLAGIFAVVVSFLASSIAVLISGVVAAIISILYPFFKSFVYMGINPFAAFFIGIALAALGSLWLIGSVYLAKKFIIVLKKYWNWNVNIVKKGGSK